MVEDRRENADLIETPLAAIAVVCRYRRDHYRRVRGKHLVAAQGEQQVFRNKLRNPGVSPLLEGRNERPEFAAILPGNKNIEVFPVKQVGARCTRHSVFAQVTNAVGSAAVRYDGSAAGETALYRKSSVYHTRYYCGF